MKIGKILVAVVGLGFLLGCGPDLTRYEYLKEPKIRTMPRQKMIVVEVKGDPSIVAKGAIKTLFKTFFKIKRKIKGMEMSPPRARFPKQFDAPREEWINIYGLPVPDEVEDLPEQKKGPEVRIEYWEYGEVAEILHIGPYSEEGPTIERLHRFIEDSGYRIAGAHEEEYLKGPGMFFRGNPAKYWTIIRYPIEKK